MISSDRLNRNLLALSSREPALSSRLSQVAESRELVFRTARNGDLVPVVQKDGRDFPLHSLFDPQKESQKFAAEHPKGGYIIFLGFGCGYHIEPFLSKPDVTGILIIDKDLSQMKALLSARDFRRIFLDSRVRFLLDPEPQNVKDFLLANCFPAVHGNIQVIPLRSRMDLQRDYFSEIFRMVKETLGMLADDFTVQTTFGKKWFINTLANLPLAEKSTSILPHTREAIVTAAGPSLEESLKTFPAKREGSLLIATDTSYSALCKRGIRPDLVVSIDCQHISYHHFLSGYDKDIPLVLDLASPAALSRLSDKPVFFTSGHPFSLYINLFWRQFPLVDTSGGNVSHAALSLAEKLGARRVTLAGADFCYPLGKSYARGTYIYPYFHSRSKRTSPGESDFFQFVFRNPNLTKETRGSMSLYTTRALQEYRRRLYEAFDSSPGFLNNLSPYSPPPAGQNPAQGQEAPGGGLFFGAGAAKCGWQDFLKSYRDALLTLPLPAPPAARYFEHLHPDKRALWMTILPAAASMRKIPENSGRESTDILNLAFNWTLAALNKALTPAD